MDQSFGRVPDDVADRLFRVDPQQMLEDAQEGNLLRCFHHLSEDRVENVQR